MNTAGKVTIGLLAAGVVVGGAFALSHVFPGVSTSIECGDLVFDSAAHHRYQEKLTKLNSMSPRSSALAMVGKLFHAAFPGCAFGTDTTAVIIGPGGTIDWQDIVAILGDKTVGEAKADPAVLAALGALVSLRKGSAGIVPDDSVGGSLKDILRMWTGAPLG